MYGVLGKQSDSYRIRARISSNTFIGKTRQRVRAFTAQIGDFSARMDEDLWGDGFDKYRTGGLLATYKINNDVTLAFGASMITGMATDKIHSPDGNPNAYLNMYDKEDYKIRGGTMYGGVIYKGQAHFMGHNSEKRLHDVQNWIHKNLTDDSAYFPDFGWKSKIYNYNGGYHPNYLFY